MCPTAQTENQPSTIYWQICGISGHMRSPSPPRSQQRGNHKLAADTTKPISNPTYCCCVDFFLLRVHRGSDHECLGSSVCFRGAKTLSRATQLSCNVLHLHVAKLGRTRAQPTRQAQASAYRGHDFAICALDAGRRNIFTIASKHLEPFKQPRKRCQRSPQEDVDNVSPAK